jgi:hypothetical protein
MPVRRDTNMNSGSTTGLVGSHIKKQVLTIANSKNDINLSGVVGLDENSAQEYAQQITSNILEKLRISLGIPDNENSD